MARGFSASESRIKAAEGYRIVSASKDYSDASLRSTERDLASRQGKVEHLYALDKNGAVLFKQEGEESTVRPTPRQVSQMIEAGGTAVVTHNHPSGKSFSSQDIMAMLAGNLAEIRAVGKEWTYSLSDPDGKFREKYAEYGIRGQFADDLSPIYGASVPAGFAEKLQFERMMIMFEAEEKASEEMPLSPMADDEHWVTGPDDLTPEGKVEQERWDRQWGQLASHYSMEELANKYGLTYSRFPTNP